MRKHLSIFSLLVSVFIAQQAVAEDTSSKVAVVSTLPCKIYGESIGATLDFKTVGKGKAWYYSSEWEHPVAAASYFQVYDSHVIRAEKVDKMVFKGWYTLGETLISDDPPVGDATVLVSDAQEITGTGIRAAMVIPGGSKGWKLSNLADAIPFIVAKYVHVYDITAGVSPSGSGTASVSPAQGPYEEGSKVTLSATESNAAYKLAYWKKGTSKVSGSDGKLSLQITAKEDAAYTALFTNRIYTVTFKDSSGTYSDNVQTVTHGQSATAPAWSRTGYSLTWDKSFSNITADTTVNAKWTAKEYSVTFHDPSGAHADVVRTVSYGQSASAPSWSRTGYKSPIWDKSFSSVTANMTVNAQWTPETYTITYNGLKQGATNPNPTTYTIESDDIVFQEPTAVVGYKFNGWDPVSVPKGSTGNKTVKANYLSFAYKPDVQSPLTYTGYSLTCAQAGTGVAAQGNQATDVGTHTATFTPMSGYCWSDGTTEPYVVEWQIVNAEIVVNEIRQSGSLTYTGEPLTPEVYARATVKGPQTVTWKYSKSPDGYAVKMPSFTDAGIHAVYYEASAPNHYSAYGSFMVTIKRAPTAVVTVTPTSLRYTRKEQGPTVTVQHCHEIADSVKRATEVGTYAVKASPDENYAWSDGETETRTFGWSIVDSLYTVQFDGNGGTGEMASTNLAYNEEYEVPECEFTKTGCEFQRWQVLIDNRIVTNYTAGVVVSNLTSVAGKPVTFKAEWTSYYTIAYDGNGATNTVMATQLVERDVTTNLTDNAYVRPGYGFLGWDDAVNKKRYEDGAAVRNLADVGATNTLKAAWSTNSYTVAFFGNGGLGEMEPQPFTYDAPQALRSNAFERPGYDFLGWTRDPRTAAVEFADQATVSNLTSAADGVVPLFAKWSASGALTNPYSIAADCNKTDNAGVKLALTPDKAAWCTVESNKTDAVEGGNDQYVRLDLGASAGDVHLTGTLTGTGKLIFYYRTASEYEDAYNYFSCEINGEEKVHEEGTVDEWKPYEYTKTKAGDEVIDWVLHKNEQSATDKDYAFVDFIKWDPQPREALTVGVTFRLNDGTSAPDDIFTNITCEAGTAIGALPVPASEGRTFLGWMTTPDGSATIDATWIVPNDEDGAQLYAKWSSGGEPTPGDPVAVMAAGVAAGAFALTIPAESGVDYGVWTNADLTVDSWGLMGKPQKGEGKPMEFEWTILPGFPQLFFRAHKVEYR